MILIGKNSENKFYKLSYTFTIPSDSHPILYNVCIHLLPSKMYVNLFQLIWEKNDHPFKCCSKSVSNGILSY